MEGRRTYTLVSPREIWSCECEVEVSGFEVEVSGFEVEVSDIEVGGETETTQLGGSPQPGRS